MNQSENELSIKDRARAAGCPLSPYSGQRTDEAYYAGWLVRMDSEKGQKPLDVTLERPEGLSDKGNAAYEAIIAVLRKHDRLSTGGCKAFYSPAEWIERGEWYGSSSELIVVYDGGDLAEFFSMDKASPTYKRHDEMRKALDAIGLYTEEGTGWYSSVYK